MPGCLWRQHRCCLKFSVYYIKLHPAFGFQGTICSSFSDIIIFLLFIIFSFSILEANLPNSMAIFDLCCCQSPPLLTPIQPTPSLSRSDTFNRKTGWPYCGLVANHHLWVFQLYHGNIIVQSGRLKLREIFR